MNSTFSGLLTVTGRIATLIGSFLFREAAGPPASERSRKGSSRTKEKKYEYFQRTNPRPQRYGAESRMDITNRNLLLGAISKSTLFLRKLAILMPLPDFFPDFGRLPFCRSRGPYVGFPLSIQTMEFMGIFLVRPRIEEFENKGGVLFPIPFHSFEENRASFLYQKNHKIQKNDGVSATTSSLTSSSAESDISL